MGEKQPRDLRPCPTCRDEALIGRLVERNGNIGIVEIGGRKEEVFLDGVPEARVGDWLLVHAGFALTKTDAPTPS